MELLSMLFRTAFHVSSVISAPKLFYTSLTKCCIGATQTGPAGMNTELRWIPYGWNGGEQCCRVQCRHSFPVWWMGPNVASYLEVSKKNVMMVCCRTVTVVGRSLVFDQLTSALGKRLVFSRHDNPQSEISLSGPKLKKFRKSKSSECNQFIKNSKWKFLLNPSWCLQPQLSPVDRRTILHYNNKKS